MLQTPWRSEHRRHVRFVVCLAALLLSGDWTLADQDEDGRNSQQGGIAWFGSWKTGLMAAEASGRPILLIAAAPHCHGVPGIW